MGLRQDGDTWVGEHAPHQIDGALPETWPSRATNGEKFGEDFIRGPEMVFSEGGLIASACSCQRSRGLKRATQ